MEQDKSKLVDLYAPPKARVVDLSAPAHKHRIRMKWTYPVSFGVIAVAVFQIRDILLPHFTLMPALVGLTFAVLITIAPLRQLAARKSGPSPWWSEILTYCVVGMFVLGALIDDYALAIIGVIPALVLMAALTLVAWIVEARHPVRIYMKGRGVVFVDATATD